MATPPEVLFDRFFRNRQHLLDEGLLGKVDLDQLAGTAFPIALLFDMQTMMNSALLVENTNIPGHVDHDPFHFDYLNANEPNAIAFCADGYSFIGITIPRRSLDCWIDLRVPERRAPEMITYANVPVRRWRAFRVIL